MDRIPRFGRQHSVGASAKRSGARITTSRPQPIMNCNKQDRSSSRVACDRPEGRRSSPLPWLVTPPRSEGAVSMGGQILRCAQDDRVVPYCCAVSLVLLPSLVTLSTFAPLSVNSAKGLARWADRSFAAPSLRSGLRLTQDDRVGAFGFP